MRHSAYMGVIAIASCAAVVSGAMLGPVARLHHHGDKSFSQGKRLAGALAAGYVGDDGAPLDTVVALDSPRAQLLLAGLVEPNVVADPPATDADLPLLPTSGPASPPTLARLAIEHAVSRTAPAALAPSPPTDPPFTPKAPTPAQAFLATPKPPASSPPPVAPPGPPADTPSPVVIPPVVIPVVIGTGTPTPPDPPSAPPLLAPVLVAAAPTLQPVSPIPEPATWVTLLVGLGACGGALRARQRRDRRSLSQAVG
jgi:hypothetical protein